MSIDDISYGVCCAPRVNTLIVVVDDSHENASLLCRLLRRVGYESIDLPSGLELLGFLRSAARPDLVILDMMMPEMDGMECLTAMRKDPRYRDIPVVMFSADSSISRQIDAKRLGAQEYMVKGAVMVDELLSTIRRYAPPLAN